MHTLKQHCAQRQGDVRQYRGAAHDGSAWSMNLGIDIIDRYCKESWGLPVLEVPRVCMQSLMSGLPAVNCSDITTYD